MVSSNTGIVPNTLTVTKDVHDALRNNPDMLDRIQGGATTLNSALLTRKGIADLLELEYYNVIEAVTETANEGQTSNPDFMATKKLLLTYTNPSPAPIMQAPSAGYHFTFPLLDGAGESGYAVEAREDGEHKTVVYEGFSFYDQKATGTDLGLYASAVIA